MQIGIDYPSPMKRLSRPPPDDARPHHGAGAGRGLQPNRSSGRGGPEESISSSRPTSSRAGGVGAARKPRQSEFERFG